MMVGGLDGIVGTVQVAGVMCVMWYWLGERTR